MRYNTHINYLVINNTNTKRVNYNLNEKSKS